LHLPCQIALPEARSILVPDRDESVRGDALRQLREGGEEEILGRLGGVIALLE
jgi:hypothetical protein